MIYDINQIYQAQFGEVGSPLPSGGVATPNGAVIRCPLRLTVGGDSFLLPFEPLQTVAGKNIIIRNHILKAKDKGTVKEVWSSDDYRIEIKGIIVGDNPDRLPEEEINRLRKVLEFKGAVAVSSPYFTLFDIQYMAIEDYEFLHTPGYNNQAYIIRGFSDKLFELF